MESLAEIHDRCSANASCSYSPGKTLTTVLDRAHRMRPKVQHCRLASRLKAFLTEKHCHTPSKRGRPGRKQPEQLSREDGLVCASFPRLEALESVRPITGNVLRGTPSLLVISVAALELIRIVLPEPSAAGEALPVELLGNFLDKVEHLGAVGPIFFVATVIGAEMVPLFPTQPLTIASGLLFGGPKGAVLAWLGTCTAAVLAFQLSRRLGRRLAERVVAEEITEEDRRSGMFSRVQDAIDSGSFQQQVIAVTLLRLTPIVPFSASNYLLGATPLKFSAYLAGSTIGLSFWCAVFATLGGASRDLLKKGGNLEALLDGILAQAGTYTEDAAVVALVLGVLTVLYYRFVQSSGDSGDKHKKDDFEKV